MLDNIFSRRPPNYLSPSCAYILRDKIKKYWTDNGYPDIDVWTEPLDMSLTFDATGNKIEPGYVVIRSNIGPTGFPPRV